MTRARVGLAQVGDWLVGSDPGFIRLRMACTTTFTLAISLLVLYLLSKAFGQPVTVAFLGVMIAMLSSAAVADPDSRQQRITTVLMPIPAAVAVTLGALLAPHRVAGDVVFVAIMVAAVIVRRFGSRGVTFGMLGFMAYFFALFLGATVSQLPWLIAAVVIGTACSFAVRTYLLPDRPERVLRLSVQSLAARTATVVHVVRDVLELGVADERHRRRIASRVAQVNQTVAMIQGQLEATGIDQRRPNGGGETLEQRLFDAELALERYASAGHGAIGAVSAMPALDRQALLRALSDLVVVRAETVSLVGVPPIDRIVEDQSMPVEVRRLGSAASQVDVAIARVRSLADQPLGPESADAVPHGETPTDRVGEADGVDADEPAGSLPKKMDPTTRQAIQVAIATSAAIVAGELVSPSRWYWCVIAAFVVFSGTTSRGQTLTKGWQRVIGTVAGVPAGVLVATAVGGRTVPSIVLIFACLFFGFYLIQVAYGLMVFWITTMLALLYGLLGQFSVGLLGTRIEETAIGAVIGIVVAWVILPTSTRRTVGDGMRDALGKLADLVDHSARRLVDPAPSGDLVDESRLLHQTIQELDTTAKPLTKGIAGLLGRFTVWRAMRTLKACDHYGRSLARNAEMAGPAALDEAAGRAIVEASARVQANIESLSHVEAHHGGMHLETSTGLLDLADLAVEQSTLDQLPVGCPGQTIATRQARERLVLAALNDRRSIDQLAVDLAHDLGQATPSKM